MPLDIGHLEALAAIVDTGSFDAAGRQLALSQSAVSQRIRSLETRVGHILIDRGPPCRPTGPGKVVLRLARQVAALQSETLAELHTDGHGADVGRVTLSLGINADSLATWFRRVLATYAETDDTDLDLTVDDQAHTTDLLRTGAVVGAITDDPVAIRGCSVQYLGRMRYLPCAEPRFATRWRDSKGRPRWNDMPLIKFDHKDRLPAQFLSVALPQTANESAPTHSVPSSHDLVAAVCTGLGWSVIPEQQALPELASGKLVTLDDRFIDVKLYWQVWRLQTPSVARLTESVRAASEAELRTD
ncbi:MAG TPA: ArgP/LysG family DNA-binding transcriptional regulator [Mycobacterium sp.]|nr:ArgP/LysG family DNA-binding transcriptional regulator [Mycobacterium sp.]